MQRHPLFAALVLVSVAVNPAFGQSDPSPDAAMLRFPDIGPSHIVFVHANDLWIVPREGGAATPLASPPGQELFPKFSPDGRTIAFVGNYDGNRDIYTVLTAGGVPQRVTHHPGAETLCDFVGGDRLLLSTSGLAGLGRQTQLFTVSTEGGLPEKVPVPYGAWGSISPDGTWLAYIPHSTDFRTWKRYRGGMATDIWLYNLRDGSSRRMTDWEGTDTAPMWIGSKVYYLSDQGPEHRLNIWSFDPATGQRSQITRFADFDVKWPSAGPGGTGGEIVFQVGSALRVLDVASGTTREVRVTVPGARPKLRPRIEDAAGNITERSISPSGKRVAVSGRGDIWSLPAEQGSPRNFTRTSGAFERSPSWSPDGRWIVYLSDESGEYEFYLMQSDGRHLPERLTHDGSVFRYGAIWAPDSKKFLFADKTGSLWLYTLGEQEETDADAGGGGPGKGEGAEASTNGDGSREQGSSEEAAKPGSSEGDGEVQEDAEPASKHPGSKPPPRHKAGELKLVDRDPWGYGMQPSWSHDSAWVAYQRSDPGNPMTHLRLYEVATGTSTQVTSGMFRDSSPAFDRKGDWLYFTSNRDFSAPRYEDLGTTFVYDNTGVLLAVPLRKDVKNPLLPKSDEEEWSKEGKKKESAKEKKGSNDSKAGGDRERTPAKEAAADDGVSGTWELTLKGIPNMPELAATATVRVGSDGSVSGSIQSMMGTADITRGTWTASTKVIEISFAAPDGSAGSMRGTVADGTIEGTWSVGDVSGTFTGRRTAAGNGGGDGQVADADAGEKEKKASEAPKTIRIDLDGFESRAIQLPLTSGTFGDLAVNDGGALIYVRRGGRGGGGDGPSIKLFDLADDKRSEKTVTAGGSFRMSADGKRLLVGNSIVPASAGASGKPFVTQGMLVSIDPRAEWEQIVRDAWRIFRDWFYDPNMHQVDWKAVGERYKAMLPDCASREDVAYVISEMISELNVGHAYYQGGGDVETSPSLPVGLLGCDFELDRTVSPPAYRIVAIHQGAPWDSDARGPLSAPGVDVAVGDYLLAVNGIPLDVTRDPWAAFIGLAGRPIGLTVSSKPHLDASAREVVVTPETSEANLRFRAWIERNRAHVAERSNGRVGYIYVPDTGVGGQNNLFRQFFGQRHLDALIIDERWNGGGQIPTRFIELLNRPATNFWARRDSEDWRWPPDSHQGPKCMLMNGLSGSGGDAFPHYFRQAGLGKLIGTRTWGGLVGISGNPGLIDGASIAVPTFGFYELDGTWGIEGHGVDPDIEVVDDPALMADGADPQLDAAIDLMLEEIRHRPFRAPARPPYPNRSGMGLPDSDR